MRFKIESMLKDLNSRHRNKDSILESCIHERLNKSLNIYSKLLDDDYKYLLNVKNILKVSKEIKNEISNN